MPRVFSVAPRPRVRRCVAAEEATVGVEIRRRVGADRAPAAARGTARGGSGRAARGPGGGARVSAGSRLVSLPALVVGLAGLLLWDLLVRSGAVASFLLPPPAEVARALWGAATDGLLWRYARTTVIESLAGFALGSAVALPVGYGIAHSRLLARALEPYLAASQAVPAVALAPLLVLWLGYGLAPVAVLCALIVFFPTVVNTALGIRTLDREVLDAARVDGADRWALLRGFEVPLALPSILAGLRTSLTLSVTGAVVGEFVLGDRGLGGLLTIARGNFDTPLVFATIVTLTLLAAGLYGAARLVERRLIWWEEED
ncbi:MAG: ABC transporter permease [Thermomicrobiaceae bacterium]|nr:ABC transporter permease [Thermomicrobiaceae bacterium]